MGKVLRGIVKGAGVVALFCGIVVVDFLLSYECKIGVFNVDTEFLSNTMYIYIVIHHTATDKPITLQQIEDFHRSQSWGKNCGFAYHWYVTDSAIYQLHADTAKTNHADNGWFNRRSISVCLAGNFEEREPTVRELKNLAYTVFWLQMRYNIPARRIFAHGDVSMENTACCGKYLKELLNEINDRREER